MILSVVACNDTDNDGTTTTTTTAPPPPVNPGPGAVIDPNFKEFDTEGYHIYVSNSGLDSNDGLTPERAVESIYRANDIARDYINGSTENKKDVVISIESGVYYAPETVKAVSGTADIAVYYTARGGRVTVSGGQNITADNIKKATDEYVLSRIKNDEVKNNLWEIDLSMYSGLTPLFDPSNLNTFTSTEFYSNELYLLPARWPNADEIIPEAQKDHPTNTTNSNNLHGYFITEYLCYIKDGAFKTPTEVGDGADKQTLPLVITFKGDSYDRISGYDFENEDIYTHDFFSNNWDDMIHKVTSFYGGDIKMMDGKTYEGYITLDRGRQYNGELALEDANGAATFRRGYFFNVIEEIDTEGEYYYDYDNKAMYLYAKDEAVLDSIFVSLLPSNVFEICGTKDSNIENVHIRNIDVMHGIESLLFVNYAKNITVNSCEIANCTNIGVDIQNSENVRILNSKIHRTGYQTVAVKVCHQANAGQPLTEADILIENCEIFDMGNKRIVGSSAVGASYSSGLTVRNCTMYGGGHQAVGYTDMYNLIVEYCDIYDFITESDDVGLFYGVGQYNSNFGSVMRYNYIHDLYTSWAKYGICIFYHDYNGLGYQIYGNVIANIAAGNEEAKIALTSSVRGVDMHDNLAINIYGNRQQATYIDLDWDVLTASTWWRCMYGEETQNLWTAGENRPLYQYIDNSGLFGAWDNSSAATDESRNYLYKKMKEVLSEEFALEMFSHGAAELVTPDNNWLQENGYVIIDDEEAKKFKIKILSGSNEGTYTPTSTSDMFQILVEKAGWTGNVVTIPTNVTVYYGETRVKNLTYNIYEKDGDSYRLSPAAKALKGENATISDFNGGSSVVASMTKYYFYSDKAFLGEFHNNIMIGMPYHYEIGASNIGNCVMDYYDNEVITYYMPLFEEDGSLGIDLSDVLYEVTDSKFDFEMLDISKTGSDIKW